jgi:hypothetical protein
MKPTHQLFVSAGSFLRARYRVGIVILALAGMLSLESPACGQSAVWQPPGATTGSIYYNGGNVGIGTATPESLLTVSTSSGQNGVKIQSGGVGLYLHAQSAGVAYVGTGSNHRLGLLANNTEQLTIIGTGNVGIGTTNPQYKLAVNGTIGAQDIIVTATNWSDYVFKPGYRLRPLSEVNQFIQTNGHLSDIPTEADVKENGISVGDMQAKLLAKVEELTLHMIQADERNRRLERQNQDLRERLERLEKSATADSIPAVAK